jgi:hypothetical protein
MKRMLRNSLHTGGIVSGLGISCIQMRRIFHRRTRSARRFWLREIHGMAPKLRAMKSSWLSNRKKGFLKPMLPLAAKLIGTKPNGEATGSDPVEAGSIPAVPARIHQVTGVK